MPLDLTVSAGDVVTTAGFIITGLIGVMAIRNSVNNLATRVGINESQNERRFNEIDTTLDRLQNVVVRLTEQDGRLNIIDDRMLQEGRRIDSLSQTVRDLIIGRQSRVGGTGE